jgi:hypothetical protein
MLVRLRISTIVRGRTVCSEDVMGDVATEWAAPWRNHTKLERQQHCILLSRRAREVGLRLKLQASHHRATLGHHTRPTTTAALPHWARLLCETPAGKVGDLVPHARQKTLQKDCETSVVGAWK